MASSASRKVIRRRQSFEEMFNWYLDEPPASAREARYDALVAAAILDRALEDAIARRLGRLNKRQTEELFAESGVLGTFSDKIKMGHALRLFGPKTKADLNHIRDIRNIFAHAERPINFRTQRVVDICRALDLPKRQPHPSKRKPVSAYRLFRHTTDALAMAITPPRKRLGNTVKPSLP